MLQAFGVYNQSVYSQTAARKDHLDVSATTAAEVRARLLRVAWLLPATDQLRVLQCVALVRKSFPDANAAEFSNTGLVWCNAVYNASGLIYEPTLQTCLFDDSWPAGSQDRRRLEPLGEGVCEAVKREDLDKLKTELKTELQASHAHELKKLEDKLSKQEDRLSKQQARTNALLEKQEDKLSKQQAQTNALLEKLLNHTGSGM